MKLNHRNLNEFIGAYVSPPAVYVCTAYCAKGSVWDVVNHQSILLSWDFRLSLIIDIAKVCLSINQSIDVLTDAGFTATCDQQYVHCVSENNTDVAHYNFNAHQLILVVFGR